MGQGNLNIFKNLGNGINNTEAQPAVTDYLVRPDSFALL